MIKIVFAIAFALLTSLTCCAQGFQGMAVYEAKTSTSDFSATLGSNSQITPEMQKRIEERMRKMFEKTFILYFDQSKSMYEEEEKLETPGSEASMQRRMISSFTGGGGKHFKDVKSKTYTIEKEMMGKEFLVKDSLPKMDWKMTGETKQIGSYTCFKATAVQPASKSDFRNYKMKKEDKKDDKAKAEADKTKVTNLLDSVEMPKEVEVVAWYTPDIPVNQGPENYWGLPGLILEVTSGKTTMLCSKVVLNPKDRKDIKEPTKGKQVTQAEFDEIVAKKMEEMQQMYQQRGSNGNFRIGG